MSCDNFPVKICSEILVDFFDRIIIAQTFEILKFSFFQPGLSFPRRKSSLFWGYEVLNLLRGRVAKQFFPLKLGKKLVSIETQVSGTFFGNVF